MIMSKLRTLTQWLAVIANCNNPKQVAPVSHPLINVAPNDQCLKQAVTTTGTTAKAPVADTQLNEMGQDCRVPILR
jgi:hypothetical protein